MKTLNIHASCICDMFTNSNYFRIDGNNICGSNQYNGMLQTAMVVL